MADATTCDALASVEEVTIAVNVDAFIVCSPCNTSVASIIRVIRGVISSAPRICKKFSAYVLSGLEGIGSFPFLILCHAATIEPNAPIKAAEVFKKYCLSYFLPLTFSGLTSKS